MGDAGIMQRKAHHMGDYDRARGWTEDVVAQAASLSGVDIFAGPTNAGNPPADYIGLYVFGAADTGPFFKQAKELGVDTYFDLKREDCYA